MMKQVFFLILFFLGLNSLYAQSLTADFSISSTACLNENIRVTNLSTNTSETNWDFCENDLLATPSFVDMGVVGASGGILDLRLANDNGSWYGFVCDGGGTKLKKLFFGNSLSNTPIQSDVANFNLPDGIEIVKFQNNWYGFVATYQLPSELYVLQFGNSLGNTPVITKANLPANAIIFPRSLSVVQEDDDLIVFVTNTGLQGVTRINFGSSFSSSNPAVDLINVPSNYLFGIDMVEGNSKKCMILTDFGASKVIRLSFDSDWRNINPITEVISTGATVIPNPTIVNWQFEGGSYYAYLSVNSGSLFKLTFGGDLENTTPVTEDLGVFGDMSNVQGMHLVRNEDHFTAIFSSYTTNKIYRMDFVNPTCNASTPYYKGTTPPVITFPNAGNKLVTVRAKGFGLQSNRLTKSIFISSGQAPQVDLNIINKQCLSVPNEFSVNSLDALTNYSWDFGDGQVSGTSNPVHSYSGNGLFFINLEVTGANGCKNRIQDQIVVNSAPDFLIPVVSPVCTSVPYDFTNLTSFDANYEPVWTWSLNGTTVTNQKIFTTTFNSTGPQQISLSSSNGGCTNEITRTFNVTATGSLTDFSTPTVCEQVQMQFENHSSSDIVLLSWDFGDGLTSVDVNPQHIYASANTYSVKLKTISSNGCVNEKSKQIQAYSKPQPNFSLDLPPFSCSGTPSQFNDLTPGPTDSNLSSWAWNFGDAGTSTDRNPLHTFTNAGDYNVSLTATTNFGCSASFQKSVNIAASPPADFTYTPACINQGTRFTDASGSGVKSWFWTIGSSTYAFSNPTHVFSGSGSFSAKLTVTGNNNCVATVTKTINVPVVPSLSFSVDNACEKQAANFKDTSPANTDPAASWSWDFAGQGTSTGNVTQYSFAKAGSYAVKMTSTQQSGCVYSLSKNVTINTTPVAAFTSSPEWGVPPLTVQFTNTSTGANSYLWHFNDKNNSTSTLTSPGFVFTDLGDYVVDLLATSALGCSGSASGKISVIIPSLDLELKQLQLVKDPTSNVYRIFVTVKNKSNYLLTSVDVVVDISGNALIKETINTNLLPDAEIVQLLNNQILPHGNSLTYLCASIEVDNDNDPFNNSRCEPLEEETIVFDPYPNPSNGTFRFQWIASATDNAHFEIFNAMGQLSFEQDAESVQIGLNQMQFDLSNLNTGAYYFRFSSNSVSKTLPIQIVR